MIEIGRISSRTPKLRRGMAIVGWSCSKAAMSISAFQKKKTEKVSLQVLFSEEHAEDGNAAG